MSSFDPSSQVWHIIPYRVCLKWLLPLFSLFNSDDAIREIPSRWDFHCACVDSVYTPPHPPRYRAPPYGSSCQIHWAHGRRGPAGPERRGSAVVPVWANRGKYGQIWSVLSIMSRWNRPDQITNLELITKVVAGLCFIPSPTLLSPPLWRFLPPSVRLSQGSPSFSPEHHTGCFINSVSPDYTLSVSQGTLIGI